MATIRYVQQMIYYTISQNNEHDKQRYCYYKMKKQTVFKQLFDIFLFASAMIKRYVTLCSNDECIGNKSHHGYNSANNGINSIV